MRRFFSVWLILLVIAVFAAVLLVSYPVLTTRALASASDDLNVLLDAAFTRISLAQDSAKAVADAANSNVLSKARAVDRFLAHDDALLATDALVSLCELLNVSSVDVTDMDGNIVASSTDARIGRSLVTDRKTEWTNEVLVGENLSRTHVDEANSALLAGCVSRTDTEGLIFIQSLDVSVMEAAAAASPEQVLLDMSFIKDTLALPDANGDFDVSGYSVTRTQDDITLSASRPFSQVYAVRSAVLFVEATGFLLTMVFAAVVQSLLIKKRLSSRKGAIVAPPEIAQDAASSDAPVAPEAAESAAPEGEETAPENAGGDEARPPRRKKRKPRQKIFEFVDVEEKAEAAPEETPEASNAADADAIEEEAAAANVIAGALDTFIDAPENASEESVAEEAAVEFAAPEAVMEEPAPEEEPPAPQKKAKRKREPRADDAPATSDARKRRRKPTSPDSADGAFDKIFD